MRELTFVQRLDKTVCEINVSTLQVLLYKCVNFGYICVNFAGVCQLLQVLVNLTGVFLTFAGAAGGAERILLHRQVVRLRMRAVGLSRTC